MKLKNLFMSALCVISLGMLSSCTEKTPEGPVYSDKPFDTISLEVDGEKVEGVVVDNTISFSFTTAENFSAAKLILKVNDGWKLVFPADPDNYDVSTDPNIYFTDPNGKKVQYVVTITSNALPVADGSKVTVEGGYTVTYNVATKAFVITYAAGMDRKNVTLVFGEGALMEGATVENPTLDLSEGPAEISITVGTTTKKFPVSLDYSAVLVNPISWGFEETTTDEQKAKIPSLTVLHSTGLSKQVPAPNIGGERPVWWDGHGGNYDTQIARMGLLGDYDASREKVDMTTCDFTIVTFNERDYKGKIISDATAVKSGKSAESVKSLITMSGCPAAWTCWVKSEGQIVSKESAAWWTGVKAKGTSHSLCFGFDSNDKMGLKRITPDPSADIFHVLGDFRKASDFGFNYKTLLDDTSYDPFRNDFEVKGENWDVTGAAYFSPALVVDGYKVHFADAMANNADPETIGEAFNGDASSRCFIGRTIDNKLGLATINTATNGKTMNIMQGAYVLADLGWTDVYYVGGANWQADSFQPTIVIDGAVVAGQEGQMAKYVIAFEAK